VSGATLTEQPDILEAAARLPARRQSMRLDALG
jgi:hypothetical protein